MKKIKETQKLLILLALLLLFRPFRLGVRPPRRPFERPTTVQTTDDAKAKQMESHKSYPINTYAGFADEAGLWRINQLFSVFCVITDSTWGNSKCRFYRIGGLRLLWSPLSVSFARDANQHTNLVQQGDKHRFSHLHGLCRCFMFLFIYLGFSIRLRFTLLLPRLLFAS